MATGRKEWIREQNYPGFILALSLFSAWFILISLRWGEIEGEEERERENEEGEGELGGGGVGRERR